MRRLKVPTRAWTHADPQLLRRVLQNFLANAVRYTRTGGVLLGVRRHGDSLLVEVHDTGPGIAPGQRDAIFEEFRRGPDAPGQGLGLGLSIAQRIAGLLDAPICLRSTPGRGTAFALRIPHLPVPSAHSAPGKPAHAASGFAGLRVLVVDNVPTVLDALCQMLERWGCTVLPCADGGAAMAALSDRPADLWLLDYHLDHGDTGVALHQRLVQAHGARPALVLSADHTGQVRRAVHEAGLPLLQKPVKALALKSVLDRLLAARGG